MAVHYVHYYTYYTDAEEYVHAAVSKLNPFSPFVVLGLSKEINILCEREKVRSLHSLTFALISQLQIREVLHLQS